MCGIAGFIGFKNDNLIKQMSQDMLHRGPDGEGYYMHENVSLLNRRLAIIDRKGGDQPIYNEDKTIAVVYNGEIYNYQELRTELAKHGHIFSTHSDTEVIVHGYEQWGDHCFDRFNGMFGVGLYDSKRNRLLLARDHFGIKPLYYSRIDDTHDSTQKLLFASEIKPLLNSGLINTKPNDKIIYRYLKFRIHDDQDETFFENIYRVMPGEMLIIENDTVKKEHFSTLETDLNSHSEAKTKKPAGSRSVSFGVSQDQDTTQKFKELLTDAVRLRLISEVPVGTCLSGGLDSSSVVAIVNKLLHEHVKEASSLGGKQNTFSAVFPGSTNDEEKYIDELLQKLKNVESHKVYPKPENFFEEIADFIRTQEEPTISTGPYAQYKVMQEAHKYVTVLLDGQGADEMMAGYLPYYFVYLKQLKKEKKWFQLLTEVWNSRDVLVKYGWLKLLRNLSVKKDVPVSSLLQKTFTAQYRHERFIVADENLKTRLTEDIFRNSLQSLLRYEDRNSMRFSIEGRVPFLDFRLLRYLFSLPNKAIINHGWNKYILRESVKDLLPSIITKRRNKIGFTTPEYEWFMRMKNRIYGIFLSEAFAKRKYFNQQEVLKAFQQFIEGKNDDTMVFWRLLNLELWLREFFDEKSVGKKEKEWQFGTPNQGKKLEIAVNESIYARYPVKTELFKKGDHVNEKIKNYLQKILSGHPELVSGSRKWFIVISEKVVAISQGRSYFIWDINPSIWATWLSKFVTRTPYGIGLGSPWTMQIAINEVGLPRILFAALASIITKPFGKKGVFYNIAGREVAAIDGPTEYSLYPSNVSAKLGPKDPQSVAESVHRTIGNQDNFLGVVIIDANDLGRNVLGNSTSLPNSLIEDIFKDNPMGQANEQTPLVLVTFDK